MCSHKHSLTPRLLVLSIAIHKGPIIAVTVIVYWPVDRPLLRPLVICRLHLFTERLHVIQGTNRGQVLLFGKDPDFTCCSRGAQESRIDVCFLLNSRLMNFQHADLRNKIPMEARRNAVGEEVADGRRLRPKEYNIKRKSAGHALIWGYF